MNPKILLVEDNEDNLETLATFLEFSKYSVATARDGQAALDAVEKEKPDVIFLDLSIPIIDGWEVARRIRSKQGSEKIVIIAFSAMALPQEMEKALQAGCDAFLSKPMPPNALIEEMNKILNKKND
ncbi:MAG: response regulator [Candidatus Auribacterota bacterium]|jgi:CheY-like chemotaxis protein|uniref:Response regulator n=1 Tax=Candidatus Auribacter fodinae TaxID=2093366 RepID=A0A3A4QZG3_9BACT|nr:MAG: response regulator [Candidatus Auribacter fodinae]